MGLEVTGLEDMIAELEALSDPAVALEATRDAVRTGAEIVRDRVLATIPVRAFEAVWGPNSTALPVGVLKEALEVYTDTYQDGSVSATVAFTNRVAHVANWVEDGHRQVRGGYSKVGPTGKTRGPGREIAQPVPAHPFFRPAVEGTQVEVAEAVSKEFTRQIDLAKKKG